jgi:hypothetical protein
MGFRDDPYIKKVVIFMCKTIYEKNLKILEILKFWNKTYSIF